MDLRTAFEDRLARNLRQRLEAAASNFKRVDAQMAASGRGRSGARLLELLRVLEEQIVADVDWCLREVQRLPGDSAIHRQIWPVLLREHTKTHLEQLLHTSRLLEPMGADHESIRRAVDEKIQKIRDRVEGDFKDFEANLWEPRERTMTTSSTKNTINNFGDVYGIQQQAGASAAQTAQMDVGQIAAAVSELEKRLKAIEADGDLRAEIEAELETIRREIKRSHPNFGVVRAAAAGLRSLALNIAGNLLTPEVQQLLRVLGL
jgi:chaperonin cofactor prefoldin